MLKGACAASGGVPVTPFCCPRCGEDRLIDLVVTAGQVEAFCAVCGHTWRPERVKDGDDG